MNQQVATQQKPLPAREVGMASGNGSQVNPQNLAEVVRFAEVMSNGGIALPKHLRGNPGTCMAVTLQALQWEMNPFAVAQKSYEVNGMIAYEAQLIAAVVNTRSGIEGRLKYQFEGSGDDLKCKVTGKVDGEVLEYESRARAISSRRTRRSGRPIPSNSSVTIPLGPGLAGTPPRFSSVSMIVTRLRSFKVLIRPRM